MIHCTGCPSSYLTHNKITVNRYISKNVSGTRAADEPPGGAADEPPGGGCVGITGLDSEGRCEIVTSA